MEKSFILNWRRPKRTIPLDKFEGRYYYKNSEVNWPKYIPIPSGPVNYLEIGVADGGHAIHIARSYAKHPESKIYCVDPWEDYDEYPEYKGYQEIGWNNFNKNIGNSGHFDKFIVHRGCSNDIVPDFEDNFFDIIYVDGNHEEDFVYEDGVMALEKCKPGGYIVFDDYQPGYWDQTIRGIDSFQEDFKDQIDIVSKMTPFCHSIVRKK